MMNELKGKLVALGLSEEMTGQVIATMADHVKGKIPASFHPMIDEVLAGDSSGIDGILGSISSLFGDK